MAKQRGVVQLSGRVDNLCYYQQKRVRGGLVRRINLAMSERVKTGAEYANLRTANSFFGACSMLAAALINLLNQRALYMTRSDRQSFVTKSIHRLFLSTGRNSQNKTFEYMPNDKISLPAIFNSITKIRATEYFPSLPDAEYEVPIDATMVVTIPSEELARYCRHFNGEGVVVNFYYDCAIYYGQYRDETQKYESPQVSRKVNRSSLRWSLGDGDLELLISAGVADDTFTCYIIVFDIVRYTIGDRPVLLDSASTAHMVGVFFN